MLLPFLCGGWHLDVVEVVFGIETAEIDTFLDTVTFPLFSILPKCVGLIGRNIAVFGNIEMVRLVFSLFVFFFESVCGAAVEAMSADAFLGQTDG